MNICLVGSMRDQERIDEISRELRQRGNKVMSPMDQSEGRFADKPSAKLEFMKGMFEQIKKCDAVLAVNDRTRSGYKGYIGANTFLQLGMGMAQNKLLFCLEDWDNRLPYNDELSAMGINHLDLKSPV